MHAPTKAYGHLTQTSDLAPSALLALVYRTLKANRMSSGVHIRLMVTRGLKKTVGGAGEGRQCGCPDSWPEWAQLRLYLSLALW